MPKFLFSLTTLVSDNYEAARQFYRDTLGLDTKVDSGSHVIFTSGLSIWEGTFARDLVFATNGADSAPRFSHELCFDCEHLDEAEEFLQRRGVDFVHKIREQPWAQRVMRIRDPDGRYIEIGEPISMTVGRVYRETQSREETSKRTYIPEEALDAFLSGKREG